MKQQTFLALIHEITEIPCDAILAYAQTLDHAISETLRRGPHLILVPDQARQALERKAAHASCVVEYFTSIDAVYEHVALNSSRPTPFAVYPWAPDGSWLKQ
jgi:hypothetical protein